MDFCRRSGKSECQVLFCLSWQNPQPSTRNTLFQDERRQPLLSTYCRQIRLEPSAALTHYRSSILPNLPFPDTI